MVAFLDNISVTEVFVDHLIYLLHKICIRKTLEKLWNLFFWTQYGTDLDDFKDTFQIIHNKKRG